MEILNYITCYTHLIDVHFTTNEDIFSQESLAENAILKDEIEDYEKKVMIKQHQAAQCEKDLVCLGVIF